MVKLSFFQLQVMNVKLKHQITFEITDWKNKKKIICTLYFILCFIEI